MAAQTLLNKLRRSTVIAQLVFTLGGSNFAGANGSMMIEVVVCPMGFFERPFPHSCNPSPSFISLRQRLHERWARRTCLK